MSLYDLCQKYDIKFKKSLGQNLLLDDNINRIMVDAAGIAGDDFVIEVGAGLGALTARLGALAKGLLSIEIDRTFMPCLEDQFGAMENIRLFRGDVLNHPVEKLLDEFLPGGGVYKMVSNLPYYITTPILFHFWESSVHFDRIVVMVQEEVGQRMVAQVGASDYGAFSLAARYYAEVDLVHKVPNTCFKPQPKVHSCIVRCRARKEPLYPGLEGRFLLSIVRTAFSQRRKTLRNSLTRPDGIDAPKELTLDAMDAAGIDASRRPQTLTLDEFAELARELAVRMKNSSTQTAGQGARLPGQGARLPGEGARLPGEGARLPGEG